MTADLTPPPGETSPDADNRGTPGDAGCGSPGGEFDQAMKSLIVSKIPEIMWVARPDGFVIQVNEDGLKYLGQPFEKVSGWTWLQSVHHADRERVMHAWIAATMAGQSYEITYRMAHLSGRYRQVLVRAQPVRDETGGITAYVGSHTDLESLGLPATGSSAEAELERLQAIVAIYEEHCPAAIACVDESLQLVRINARFCDMAGVQSLDQAGKPLEEVLGKDGRQIALAASRARETRKPQVAMLFSREEHEPRRRVRQWRLSLYPAPEGVSGISVVLIASEQ